MLSSVTPVILQTPRVRGDAGVRHLIAGAAGENRPSSMVFVPDCGNSSLSLCSRLWLACNILMKCRPNRDNFASVGCDGLGP